MSMAHGISDAAHLPVGSKAEYEHNYQEFVRRVLSSTAWPATASPN